MTAHRQLVDDDLNDSIKGNPHISGLCQGRKRAVLGQEIKKKNGLYILYERVHTRPSSPGRDMDISDFVAADYGPTVFPVRN